jgi:hypothetical protein
MIVMGQLLDAGAFCHILALAISLGAVKKPVSHCTSVIIRGLGLTLEKAVEHWADVWETLLKAVEHWIFLVGELGRRMSGEGCLCEVVGTDRPFECERKRARN